LTFDVCLFGCDTGIAASWNVLHAVMDTLQSVVADGKMGRQKFVHSE